MRSSTRHRVRVRGCTARRFGTPATRRSGDPSRSPGAPLRLLITPPLAGHLRATRAAHGARQVRDPTLVSEPGETSAVANLLTPGAWAPHGQHAYNDVFVEVRPVVGAGLEPRTRWQAGASGTRCDSQGASGRHDVRVVAEAVVRVPGPLDLAEPGESLRTEGGRDTGGCLIDFGIVEIAATR